LSSSLNIPAVYLAEKLGVNRFTDLLVQLGVDSLEAQRNSIGVGLAIGNAEISLYELVRAYAVFPRGGFPVETVWNADGATAGTFDNEQNRFPGQIFNSETTRLIESILSDNVNRILGFGRRGLGTSGFDAMMKTGTSNQFNNIWAVGATPVLVCGVWMGNFSGKTVIGSPGSGLPAEALVDVLSKLQKGETFGPMEGLHEVEICPLSGGAVTEACPSSMSEWFRAGEEPEPCSYHIRNGDRAVINYPSEYRSWAELYGIAFQSRGENARLEITNPPDGSVFFYDSSLPSTSQGVAVDIEGGGILRLVINGITELEASLPFRWFLPMKKGFYRIRAESDDESCEIAVELR
jgi:penicillin-binding protein 1C